MKPALEALLLSVIRGILTFQGGVAFPAHSIEPLILGARGCPRLCRAGSWGLALLDQHLPCKSHLSPKPHFFCLLRAWKLPVTE